MPVPLADRHHLAVPRLAHLPIYSTFFPSFHNLKRSVEGCFLCLWAWVKEAVLVGEIRKKKRKLGVRWYIVANLTTKTIKQC